MGGIVAGGLMVGIGILFMVVPGFIHKLGTDRPECTYLINAAVIGFEEDRHVDVDTRSKTLFPVLDFVYNGKHYKYTSWYGQYPAMCMIGDRIPLDIDPHHPETHCFRTYLSSNRNSGGRALRHIMCTMGIVFIVLGGAALVSAFLELH